MACLFFILIKAWFSHNNLYPLSICKALLQSNKAHDFLTANKQYDFGMHSKSRYPDFIGYSNFNTIVILVIQFKCNQYVNFDFQSPKPNPLKIQFSFTGTANSDGRNHASLIILKLNMTGFVLFIIIFCFI